MVRQIGYGARNSARKPGEEADELRVWRGYLCHEIERAQHGREDAPQRAYELAREMVRLVRRRGAYTEPAPMLPCWECMHTWEAHHATRPDHLTGIPLEAPCACRAGACPCVGYVDPLSCATCGCREWCHDCGSGACLECSECEGYQRRRS